MLNSKIQIKEINKFFQQEMGMLHVLQSASYTFFQGKTYAITGASGIGKSTLIGLLAGLDEPTSGTVYFNEHDINLFDTQQKSMFLNEYIGIVFQFPYLIKELTVLENVIIKGLIRQLSNVVCKEKGLSLLKSVGLLDHAHRMPAALSGGQQQRVALARALFGDPVFLLADELTGNLDSKTGAEIIELLINLHKNHGMGIIVSSHDPQVAKRMEIVLELKNGIIEEIIL